MNAAAPGSAGVGSVGGFRRWFNEVGPGLRIESSDRRAAREITRLLMVWMQVSDDGDHVVRSTIPSTVNCRRGVWDIHDEGLVRALVARLFERACRRTGVDVGRLSLIFVDEPNGIQPMRGSQSPVVRGRRRVARDFALEMLAGGPLAWAQPPEASLSCGVSSVALYDSFALDRRQVVAMAPAGVIDTDVRRISQQHAEILHWRGRWAIRDLGSRHGTEVDGRRVDGSPIPLGNRAEIILASKVHLTFATSELRTVP